MKISKTGKTIIWSGLSVTAIFLTAQSFWQGQAPAQRLALPSERISTVQDPVESFSAASALPQANIAASTTPSENTVSPFEEFCDVIAFEEMLKRNPEKPISELMIEKAVIALQSMADGVFNLGIPIKKGWPEQCPQQTGLYYYPVFDEINGICYIEKADIKIAEERKSWHYITLDRRLIDLKQYFDALDDPDAAVAIFNDTPRSTAQELMRIGLPDHCYLCYKSDSSPPELGRLTVRFGPGLTIDVNDDGIGANWWIDKVTPGTLQGCSFTLDFNRGTVNYHYNRRDRAPLPIHWPEEGWQDFDLGRIKEFIPIVGRLVVMDKSLPKDMERNERERQTPQYLERAARDRAYDMKNRQREINEWNKRKDQNSR